MLLCDTVVPFTSSGHLDHEAVRAHLLWLAASGLQGFAPGMSEMFVLDPREKEHLLAMARDALPSAPLLAPVWDPAPKPLFRLAAVARDVGAYAAVVPPPLLTRVPDSAIVEWYRMLAKRLPLPVLAWHDPRFGNTCSPTLCQTLLDEAGVAGILDVSADPYRVGRLAELWPARVTAGGDGVARLWATPNLGAFVSRVANVYPQLAARLYVDRDPEVLDAVQERARQLGRAGGIAATKRLLGMGARLPLVGVDEAELQRMVPPGFA